MGRLHVVSDVHGYRDDLVDGLEDVGFTSDDELWVLGDLLDRGPDGLGVIEHVRWLQQQAPGQVHVLMGNHEILALGRRRFPGSRFERSWRANGGRPADQEGLTPDHVEWLASLPLMANVGDYLFVHSDTTAYTRWGRSTAEVNDTVRTALADPTDLDAHWEVWEHLTSRYHFGRADGHEVAQDFLGVFGGELVVHGHSIIGTLLDISSSEVEEPLLYADGLVLDIDGGRYDDGPLFLVELG